MALDLDALKFLVDTSELDSAITKIDKLGTAVTALNKPLQTLEKETQKATKAQTEQTKAQDENTKSTKTNLSVLERQQQILEFMTQGFSKGQASILTYAKAAGAATDELNALGEVQKTMRKLQGGDPFDKSTSGLISLTNKLGEAKEANRLYTAGIELTKSQTRELARDKERIIELMKLEGASLSDIKNKLRDHNAEYIAVANSINRLDQAEQKKIQTEREAGKATDFLTREMNRAENALNGMNESMNISTSNRLLRFKEGLKSAGVEAGVATTMLEKYEATLRATDAASATKKGRTRKDELDYLARATSVQLGDIGVSLAGGQNPLIVMIQQGDQLRSVLNQVGGDAKEMQQAMSLAFKQIVVGFIDVGKALGTFVAGAFKDTAASILKLAGDISGTNRVIDMFSNKFKLMQADTNSFVASMGNFGSKLLSVLGPAAVGVAAVSLAAFAVALGAAGFAIAAVIKEENELARALAVSGGSLGLNLDAALQYAEGMKSAGISTSKAMDVIREMSKTGKLFAGDISLITKTAVDMETYVGVSIEDTVKAFAKMRDKPVEAMIELAKATGLVPPEIIKMVAELESQGRSADASALAIKTLADVNNQQISRMKQDYNGFSLFMIELGKSIGNFYDNVFKSLFTKASPKAALEKQLAAIEDLLGNNAGVVGLAVGGLGIGREGYEAQRDAIKEQLSLLDKANMKEQERIANNSFLAGVQKETEELRSKQLSKEQKYLNEIAVLQNKIAEAKQRGATTDQVSILQAEITKKSLEYQESLEKKEKKSKSTVVDVSSVWEKITDAVNRASIAYDEVVNGATKYTNSQKVMMDLINDPKFLSQPESLKAEALARLASAHALEAQVIGIKAEAEAHKENQKALDDWIASFIKSEELRNKAISEQEKLNAEVAGETEQVRIRIRTIGMESAEREKYVALLKAQTKYTKELADIKGDKAGDKEIRTAEALARYEQTLLNINSNVAIDAAEKLLAEYNRIRDGITDSIVTALFEGGKAGSKKLRDLIVAELKKPITMVVNALVNTLMNSVTGGVAGSAVSGVAGSAAGGLVGSALGGVGMMGTTGLANITGMLGGDALGVMASGATGGFGSALGSALMQVPVWGWIVGGLASIATLLDDSGTMHTGGGATYSAANGASASQVGFTLNESDISQSAVDFAKQFTTAIGTMLDDTAKVFGKTAGYEISTAFADDTSKDGSWGSLVIKKGGETLVDWATTQTSRWAPKEFADGEAGRKEYLIAVAKDVRTTLKAETPDWADTMLDALGDAPSIEGLTQTVILINQTNAALKTMGSASAAFASLTDEATAALIKAAGGAAQLTASLSSYYTNFYSEEERKALETTRLQGEFAKLNKTMPTTREQFRAMMDAAVKAGDTDLVTKLLKLAPAFASVTKSTDELVSAAKEAADKLAKEKADKIKEEMDAAKKATDDAYSSLQKSISKQKELLSSQLTAAETLANNLDSIFNLLKDNVRELYAEVTATSNMQVQQAYAIISNARTTGVLPSQDVLSQSIGTVRGSLDNTSYRTKYEADRAKLLFANDLAALQGIAGEQLTDARQQIKLLSNQIKQYDLILEHAETQINELRGINTSVLSVTSAVDALTAALIGEKNTKTSPSKTSPSKTSPSKTSNSGASFGQGTSGSLTSDAQSPSYATVYDQEVASIQSLVKQGKFARVSDLGGYGSMVTGLDSTNAPSEVARYQGFQDKIMQALSAGANAQDLATLAKSTGMTQRDFATAMGYHPTDVRNYFDKSGIPAFAGGGNHTGGLRLVGENSPELEVTGPARYYNKDQFFDVLRSGFSGDNNSESTEMLRAEVRSIAISTSKLQRAIDALVVPTSEGEAINVKVVV